MTSSSGRPLVSVENLAKYYSARRRKGAVVRAVDDVSFQIFQRETFGLVGETGSGKSTVARLVLGIESAASGKVVFDGRELSSLKAAELRRLRREMQIVFQDPVAALNRRKRVDQIVSAPLRVHGQRDSEVREARVHELLELVGLDARIAGRYPSSLSGGQCQRVGIARALALNPRFVVLDEAVSAVDVSIRAQILNLLRDLQERLGLTYLFISHDLAIVRYMSARVAVMYLGRIVEYGTRDRLFAEPRHPYTHALMSAIPEVAPSRKDQRTRVAIEDEQGSGIAFPSGCRFHPRCPVGRDREICQTVDPPLAEVYSGHGVACHFPQTAETFLEQARRRSDALSVVSSSVEAASESTG